MNKQILSGVTALSLLGGMVCAQQPQDAPPVDLQALIQSLKDAKTKRSASEKSFAAKVTQDLRTAAATPASAIAFYDRAAQAVQGDKVRPDLAEWEKSDAAQNAAQLHLSYLLLTLQRAQGATTKQLEPALLAHIAALGNAGAKDLDILRKRERAQDMKEAGIHLQPVKGKTPPSREPLFWEQELVKQSVKNSVFVQWYGFAKLLEPAKEWEFAPGNVDGIYQSTLLPYYRQNKDARVLAYWDNKIQQAAQDAAKAGGFKADQFNAIGRPRLVWKRAQEMIAIGQRNRGLADMLTLVKSYSDHPDLNDWIAQLEALVAPAAVPQPAAGAPAETPATPAPEPSAP